MGMEIVVILFGFVFLVFAGTWRIRTRTRKIAAARCGESYQDFALHFSRAAVPTEVVEATFAYFRESMADAVSDFPVRPGDDIARIYGIVDEDLDDAAQEILSRCHRKPPETFQPAKTVEDLVYYVVAGSPITQMV
ncbi:MAG: hypothetical protein QOD99_2505 [Chthoniobacter sp.]|jgi:hypothetical protein|nr:hypothetical protein [Chthoniobacter sp.]